MKSAVERREASGRCEAEFERRGFGLFVLALAASACSRSEGSVSINGAGATFPYPLYSKWTAEYHRLNPEIFINYQSIGSGGGLRQIAARTVDFAATDVPMTEEELKVAGVELVHLPMTLGSVVVSYNLEGVERPLRFTPRLLADVFRGVISRWNAPELAAENGGLALPDLPIIAVYRTDGSGTTAIFTEFLARASKEWELGVGAGRSVRFPHGLGAKGNEGVAGQLSSMPGAIGYVELAYATQNELPCALVENRAGHFVGPAAESAAAAAAAVVMPDELHVPLANASSRDAYPLASYTYLLVPRDAEDVRKGEALANFLLWAIHDGQRYAKDLGYAPLPAGVVRKVETALRTLRAQGKTIL